MKVLHINAGLEVGGAKTHILSLLSQFPPGTAELLVLEEGSISEETRMNGIKVHVMNQQSRYDLRVLKKLTSFINTNRFDVVHTHGARANLLVALIKNKIQSTWVVTVHSDPALDFMDKGLKGQIFSFLNQWSLKKADKLIIVTERFKEELIKKEIPEEKIVVVYNGIIFDEKFVVRQPNKVFIITCIARLHPVKAHAFLFDSIKISGLINFHLNIIGDGELKKELKKKALALGFKSQIEFHGQLETIEIENILKQTDLTILASISEGFPLVLLESANQKVPFISTNVGDVARLVPNSSFSWLVPPQNASAFSKALKEAYELWSTNQLAEKGENLFQLASKEYSLEKMYIDTLSVYKNEINLK